jgi:heptaprenyl diphosphate synthase
MEHLASLVACAAALQCAESIIPWPIPGLRLGLANLVTLVALEYLGPTAALQVALLRCGVGALAMGTFLSPSFLLSVASAGVSTAVMAAAMPVLRRGPRPVLSLVGISLLGAVAHNATQVTVAFLLVVRHPGVFLFLPVLGLSAIVTGWLTGVLASAVCRRVEDRVSVRGGECVHPNESAPAGNGRVPGDGWLARGSPGLKLAVAGGFAVAALLAESGAVLGTVLLLLVVMARLGGTPFAGLATRAVRALPFLVVAFLIPVLFTPEGAPVLDLGRWSVTREGLDLGFAVALRVLVLVLASAVVMLNTRVDDLLESLNRASRTGGLRSRVGTLFVLAWQGLPVFFGRFREALSRPGSVRARLGQMADVLADVVASGRT